MSEDETDRTGLDYIEENSRALRKLAYGNSSALIGMGASQVALHRRRRRREEENDAN